MKRIIIVFFTLFALYSCENHTQDTNIDKNMESMVQALENPHQHCADNSPLKNNTLPKIYWTFENENDKKCWYLGYIDMNFFLTSEDDFLVAYATGANLEETEYQKGKWEFFNGTYGNVLYGSYEAIFQQLMNDLNKNVFHEIPSFHRYYTNTIERFVKQCKAYSITLPNNPIVIKENINIQHINTNHFDNSEIDNIENVYNLIQEKQVTSSPDFASLYPGFPFLAFMKILLGKYLEFYSILL